MKATVLGVFSPVASLARRISSARSLCFAAALLAVASFAFPQSANAALGKYLVVGSSAGNASNGAIIRLDASGLSVLSQTTTPTGPPNSSFPTYNSGTGVLMYGGSRPGTVGVFDLEDYIDNATTTVTTHSYGLGGLVDSEWVADPASGNFLSAVRSGPSAIVSYNPTTGVFAAGATHTDGIPESTWIYNGNVYAVGESANIYHAALVGGTTSGSVIADFNVSSIGVSGSTEYMTARTLSDGTTLFGNFSTNLFLFDLDLGAAQTATQINLLSTLTTSGTGFTASDGFVTGIDFDPATELFYVSGTLRDGSQGFIGRDFLVAVSKTGTVSSLLQELNGDTITVTGDSYGLAFAQMGPVPEPSSFVLAALGLAGLGWFGVRRRK